MSFLFPAFLIGGLAIAIPIVLHLLRRDVAPEVPFSAVHLLQPSPIERSTAPAAARPAAARGAGGRRCCCWRRRSRGPYRAGAAPPARIVDRRRRPLVQHGRAGRVRAGAGAGPGRRGRGRSGARRGDGVRRARRGAWRRPAAAAEARHAIDRLAAGFGATRYGAAIGARRGACRRRPRPARGGHRSPARPAGRARRGRCCRPASSWTSRTSRRRPRTRRCCRSASQPAQVIVTVRNDAAAAARRSGAAVARWPGGRVRARHRRRRDDHRESRFATRRRARARWSPASTTRRVCRPTTIASSCWMRAPRAARPRRGQRRHRSRRHARQAPPASTSGGRWTLPRPRTDALEPTVVDGGGVLEARCAARCARVRRCRIALHAQPRPPTARDALTGFVRSGGGLVVSAGPDLDASLLAGLLGEPPPPTAALTDARPRVLAVTDLRHPIFRPFGPLTANLGQVRFDRARGVFRRAGLERCGGVHRRHPGAAGAARRRGPGAAVHLGPRSPLERLSAPPGVRPVRARVAALCGAAPAGRAATALIADAPAGVPQTPGVHRLPDGRQLVLNVDTRESALSRLSAREFADMLDRGRKAPRRAAKLRAQLTEARQSYWQYGLVLMLVVLVGESVIGRAT